MSDTDANDKIDLAQNFVLRAESGELPWSELIARIDTNKALEGIEDPYEFVGSLYFSFRIVEAAAYAFRDKHTFLKKVVRELVGWCQEQRAAIERQIEINASYVPVSGLERFGQRSIEKEFRWAIRLLDQSFPAWGY